MTAATSARSGERRRSERRSPLLSLCACAGACFVAASALWRPTLAPRGLSFAQPPLGSVQDAKVEAAPKRTQAPNANAKQLLSGIVFKALRDQVKANKTLVVYDVMPKGLRQPFTATLTLPKAIRALCGAEELQMALNFTGNPCMTKKEAEQSAALKAIEFLEGSAWVLPPEAMLKSELNGYWNRTDAVATWFTVSDDESVTATLTIARVNLTITGPPSADKRSALISAAEKALADDFWVV